MAGCDYRSCDVCGGKAFYDANLPYTFDEEGYSPYRTAGIDDGSRACLDRIGDWAVICQSCSPKFRTAIVPVEQPAEPPVES